LVERHEPQVLQAERDPAAVADGRVQGQALLEQGAGPRKVVLVVGQEPRPIERPSPHGGVHARSLRRSEGEQALQPRPPLGAVAPDLPEPPQLTGEAQPGGHVVLAGPRQGRPEVVVLAVQPLQPRGLVRPRQFRLRPFGEGRAPGEVPPLQRGGLPRGAEALQGVLPDRLQHPVSGLAVRLRRRGQQAGVHPRGAAQAVGGVGDARGQEAVPLLPATARHLGAGRQQPVTDAGVQRVEHPHWYQEGQRRLRVLQRTVSRRRRGSASRREAVRALQRHHERVGNQRRDFLD
jgi:hypothetical protein